VAAQTSQAPGRATARPSAALPWWAQPAATVAALGVFGLYSLWVVFFTHGGRFHNYLSPFDSPWLGARLFPALWVVWVPLLFRASCYYYRKAYYRSFFQDPLACARPERRGDAYRGETRLPFILNNLHRFFLYLAIVVVIILWVDAVEAFFFKNGFGVGVGSLLMLLNVVLLSIYTFSCHAFRHLVGGDLDCFSCDAVHPMGRYRLWRLVSDWNRRHAMWAWLSMFSVWAVDVYIRLLMAGVIHDVRLF
jgi:hypothetical protein